MEEKTLFTRVQQKHDVEANWVKAVNFIPKVGEIIVYDPDENYNYSRVKVGDGVKLVTALPFVGEEEVITIGEIDTICGGAPYYLADEVVL